MISGIYSITNKLNNKCYYGSSINVKSRMSNHKYHLTKHIHHNPHLQNAWDKYGEDNFNFEIVEEVPKDKIFDIEQQYLNWIKIMPREWFYNITFDAFVPWRNKKHSEESKKKMRLSCRNRKPISDETRLKLSKSHLGNKSHLGYKHSQKMKDDMSVLKMGNKNSLGKTHSPETRLKISIALKKRWTKAKNL